MRERQALLSNLHICISGLKEAGIVEAVASPENISLTVVDYEDDLSDNLLDYHGLELYIEIYWCTVTMVSLFIQ